MYPIGVILYSWPIANKNQPIEKDEKRKKEGRGRREERRGERERERRRIGSNLTK